MNHIKKFLPKKIKYIIRKILTIFDLILYPIIKIRAEKVLKQNTLEFITDDNLLQEIKNNKKSIIRFGDGEFGCILSDDANIHFQKASKKLQDALLNTLIIDNDNVIKCIPGIFNLERVKKYRFSSKLYWYKFINKKYLSIFNIIDTNYIYGDSLITRCYMDLKSTDYTINTFEKFKTIWDEREIVIIEGNKTKMGVGNDLFSNAKKIERIICPSKNAFDKYDQILAISTKYCKNKLAIIALGPTATILAYDLSKIESIQALDLGHLDIEYEWFINRYTSKKAIIGKFVNEVRNEDFSDYDMEDKIEKEYEKQILIRIE